MCIGNKELFSINKQLKGLRDSLYKLEYMFECLDMDHNILET